MPGGPRADQIGSLRRPDALMAARQRFRAGEIDHEELVSQEDAAVLDALSRQRETGIGVVTDGEFRRDAWQTDVPDALDGFAAAYPVREQTLPDGSTVLLELHTKAIEGRLRQRRRLSAHESAFLASHAEAPFKITLPSPNSVVWGSYEPGLTDRVYASRDALREDLVPIYQAEVAALVDEGVGYIQLDEGFTRYGTPGWRERTAELGLDPDAALDADIATENAVYDHVAGSGVRFGSHLCRGSRTVSRGAGGYEDFAERLFAELHVERFLLEDDAGQLGDYELLRFLPADKMVVLGLVTTKHPDLEDPDHLARRVELAAAKCSLDQLAISPQCGFGGSADNDFMAYERQFEKLSLLVRAAATVWGQP